MPSLLDCYQACADLTRSSSHPYGGALSLFPKHVRPHLQAIYAFAHIAEHIYRQPELAKKHADALRQQTLEAYERSQSQLPHLIALAHTIRHFDLPLEALHTFLDHSAKIARLKKVDTYRALQTHIDQTSGALAQLSADILLGRSQKSLFANGQAFARAHHLLRVLTNDRSRLPQQDLKKFGCKAKHVQQGVVNDAWRGLVEHYLKKIDVQVGKAEREHIAYPDGAQQALEAARTIITATTAKIRKNDYRVFDKAPGLSWLEETRLLLPLKIKAHIANLRS